MVRHDPTRGADGRKPSGVFWRNQARTKKAKFFASEAAAKRFKTETLAAIAGTPAPATPPTSPEPDHPPGTLASFLTEWLAYVTHHNEAASGHLPVV
jgi:hypothetical protein